MDETGLFYKLLPRRKFVLDCSGNKSVRGEKSMKANDIISIFMCNIAMRLPLCEVQNGRLRENDRCAGGKMGQFLLTEMSRMGVKRNVITCLLYTSPSPRDLSTSRMPSSA